MNSSLSVGLCGVTVNDPSWFIFCSHGLHWRVTVHVHAHVLHEMYENELNASGGEKIAHGQSDSSPDRLHITAAQH